MKHHPSIIVLSGNNENEKALVQDWYGTGVNFTLYKADYLKVSVNFTLYKVDYLKLTVNFTLNKCIPP